MSRGSGSLGGLLQGLLMEWKADDPQGKGHRNRLASPLWGLSPGLWEAENCPQ